MGGDDMAEALMREALESVERISKERPGAEGGEGVEVDVEAPAEKAAESSEQKPAEADELARVKDQLERVEAARKDNYDKWMRALAEMENFRKRAQKERADAHKYGHESLARELLGVVDNLERALGAAGNPDDLDPKFKQFLEGVQMTRVQFLQALERFEVRPFVSLGQPFDPARHQAVSQVESADHPPGVVVAEMQKGYTLHDRLLRPAMVAVSKASPTGGANVEATDGDASGGDVSGEGTESESA